MLPHLINKTFKKPYSSSGISQYVSLQMCKLYFNVNELMHLHMLQDMDYVHKTLKQHPRPFEESQLQERLMECVNRGKSCDDQALLNKSLLILYYITQMQNKVAIHNCEYDYFVLHDSHVKCSVIIMCAVGKSWD